MKSNNVSESPMGSKYHQLGNPEVQKSGNTGKYALAALTLILLALFLIPAKSSTSEGISRDKMADFEFREETVDGGKKFFAYQSGNPVTYGLFVKLLQEDDNFLDAFLVSWFDYSKRCFIFALWRN